MLEILELNSGVESRSDIECDSRADRDTEGLSDREIAVVEVDGEAFVSGDSERVSGLAREEFEG